MTTEQLIRGKKINEELLKWERLSEHFKNDLNHKDPIKEIENLLTGYNNLMFNFNRNMLAQLMIEALRDHITEEIIRLTNEFNEL